MPIHSEWDDTNQFTILRHHSTAWTWQELHTHNATVIPKMLESISHPVSIIADMRQTYWLSATDFVANVRQSIRAYAPYAIDLIVFVISDPSIGALLVNSHQQFDRSSCEYYTVRQVEDAREYIMQRRGQVC